MDFNTPTAPHKVGENSAMTGMSVVTLAPGAIAPEIIKPSDRPDVSEPRKRLVATWLRRVRGAAGKYAPRFKKMLEDTKFARGKQWDNESGIEGSKYVANITQRHIQQRVASLYAKNPKIIADRRKTLDFKIWDETPEMLKGAMAQAQQQIPLTGVIPQNVAELIADVTQGLTKRRMLDKVAKTAEISANYFIDQQQPPFKKQMKQMVRRVCTTGVGYVKMGYKRAMQLRPDDVAKVTDITSKIAMMEREMYDLSGDERDAKEYEIELLREQVATLQQQEEVSEEGPTFDFPKSDSIIPDPNCIALDGFVGAGWVAQRFILTPDQIKEVYKVDIGNKYIAFDPGADKSGAVPNTAEQQGTAKISFARVYEIFSKNDKMVFVVCEGYDDFLKEPGPPDIILKRFWTIFPILFNESETDEDIFPQSDVQLIRPMQVEYNRSREGLREHRHANRPMTIIAKGLMDDEDKEKMRDHPANALVELNSINPNQKIDDVFQPFKGPPIDPALYDNAPFFNDLQIVGGESESNLGGSAPASTTATATTVAETSRTTSLASNADDLDDLLSDLAGCLGEVMFAEMSADTAIKIAGNGAAWPSLNQQQIADSLYLDIEAGSSGRPNKAVEAANFDKVMPILMQIPGISADWLATQAVKRLDDRLDPTDALQAGIQSMMAANAQASASPPPQPGGSEPKPGEGGHAPQQPAQPGADLRNLPALQGMHGANNAQPPPAQPPPGGGSPMLPQPAH